MVDYDLAHWLYEQRKRFSDRQIKNYLLKYGYNEEAIDSTFDFIDAHKRNEMKMGNPPFAGGIRIGTEHWDTLAVITLVTLFFFPIAAVPLGILSLKHIKHNPHLRGKSIAIIGLVIGAIPLIILLIYISLIIFTFIRAGRVF